MTIFLSRFPFPPPFDKRGDYWGLPRDQIRIFEHVINIDEPLELHVEDPILNEKVLEMGQWVKDMEDQNPDLELVDAELIFKPKYGKSQLKAMIGAKIIMKKK